MYDYLIVGAGLTGAVCARELRQAGHSVMVLEKRSHLAGNCYDERVDGILVNRYGGHIFHTDNARIWDYATSFAEFRQYEHRVKVRIGETVYSFPPNLMTYQQLGLQPGPGSEPILKNLFFRGYTEKQWQRPLEQVPGAVLARIPWRGTWDDRYFTDRYQGLPVGGYTAWIANILGDAPLELECDYLEAPDYWRRQARQVIYTGPLDALYGYIYGRLEYRSLRFDTRTLPVSDFQGTATVNYPDPDVPYTRVMEWRHFGWQAAPEGRTVVTWEYPADYGPGREPYYPVRDDANAALYARYAWDAAADGYIPAGRLGRYQYLDMHQAIGSALRLVERIGHGTLDAD